MSICADKDINADSMLMSLLTSECIILAGVELCGSHDEAI
jgi:hypothetical protein